MVDTSTGSVRQAEISAEQRHVDRVYARVDELREEARTMRDQGFALAEGAKNEASFEQGQMLLARDVMVRHASRMLQSLDAEHEGLVFGRLDLTDGETMHIGRLGVRDADFDNLVTDWRAPAASAFYQATAEDTMNVVRRRVIRCSAETVVDIDDDLLDADALPDGMRIVGEGALMASLSRARSEKMHNIVATIQREQDQAIRAPWQGVTEITGGPGTGKTAVALHRAAYLLYRDRRRMGGAGVLVIGPSPVFTDYISRVLPSMGEDSVELRALGELLDGFSATRQDSPRIAAIKGSLRMRRVLRKETRQPAPNTPTEMRIVYGGEVTQLDTKELADVRRAVLAKGWLPNASRVLAAEALLEALWRKAAANAEEDARPSPDKNRMIDELAERIDFHRFVVDWWRLRTPAEVLSALADPQRLTRAAGKVLTAEEVELLAKSFSAGDMSVADIALLDELRVLLGKPPKRRRGRTAVEPAVSGRAANYDEYAHIVVDEAQDLSPMQWRMVGRRGRYASWTVVGDPMQSSWPDPGEATEARDRAFGTKTSKRKFVLRTNYRNSAEIFALAARVAGQIAMPEELPNAVRATGLEPTLRKTGDLPADVRLAAEQMLSAVDGTVGVITAMARVDEATEWLSDMDSRVRVVGSLDVKGLEYDGVVLVEPAELITESTTGPRGLYVALTRATQRLTVLYTDDSWLS